MIKHSLVHKGSWTFAVRKDFILDPNYSIGEKIVYQAIRSFCSADNSTAFPSVELLANALDVSRDTIYKHLSGLESKGLIMREQAKEEGRFSHTVYTVYDTEKPAQRGVLTHGEIPDSGNTDTNSTVPLVREDVPSINTLVGEKSKIPKNGSLSEFDQAVGVIGSFFNRPSTHAWSHFETSTLASIVRRGHFLEELNTISQLRSKMIRNGEGTYFPNSIAATLNTWDQVLDKARTYDEVRKPSKPSRLSYAP